MQKLANMEFMETKRNNEQCMQTQKNIPACTSSHYSLLQLVLQHKQNSQDWRKSPTSPGVRVKTIRHGKPIYARLQKHWHKLMTETLLYKFGQYRNHIPILPIINILSVQ